jgi:hypothetical protein
VALESDEDAIRIGYTIGGLREHEEAMKRAREGCVAIRG